MAGRPVFARLSADEPKRRGTGVKLLAAGRESNIFDLGDGRVLRRYKRGGRPEHEAMVMEHARMHGFPAPRVFELGAGELVLERVDGPSMLEDLKRRPWRMLPYARLLAGLHRRLHRIEAPDGLEAASPGTSLLHLDFHPGNVLLSAAGPVVIDWTNARRGEAAFDVAMTWVILASSSSEDLPAVVRGVRSLYTRAFVGQFDRRDLAGALSAAAERRLADPNVRKSEREAIRRMTSRESRATG